MAGWLSGWPHQVCGSRAVFDGDTGCASSNLDVQVLGWVLEGSLWLFADVWQQTAHNWGGAHSLVGESSVKLILIIRRFSLLPHVEVVARNRLTAQVKGGSTSEPGLLLALHLAHCTLSINESDDAKTPGRPHTACCLGLLHFKTREDKSGHLFSMQVSRHHTLT